MPSGERAERGILKSKAAPAKAEQKVTGEDARQTRRTDVVVEGTRGNILEGMVPGAGKKARKPVGKSEMSPSAVARLIEDTLANAFGSLQGKPIEMVELQEIQEGLHSEAAVEAKQAGNRLTSILIWGVPRKRRKEVVRLLSTASSENKSERMEARRKLREVSPELYNEYLSLRDKIRYFGQEIINSILSTGRPLTNRDVALIKKIAKSGDFYLTRAFKAFAKSSKVRDTHRKLIMDSVRKYNKTGEVDEYSQIFLNAVDSIKKNHLDISNFLETEKSMEDAKKGGYRFMDVAEISSLATVWLGNKAPRVEAGMDADQKEAYIEKVRATLKEKMESLGNEDYKKQLDDKAKFVAQHLLGEVGGKGGGALLNLVEAISKDTSILQKKQNVLPEIRALLGEVINPIAQLEQTLMLQAEYLASANMQQRLYDVALEGNWISDTPDSTMHTEAIPDDTLKYGPLAGMWATREFKEKFEPLVEVSASFREALTRGDPGSGMADAAIDALAKGTSLSKMITVAYNLMNPVYNFFGGMVITPIQMGYALLAPTRRNARALKNAFSVVYSSLTPENRKGMTEAYKKILGAGLQDNIELAETQKSTRESLRNQILDDIAKDVTNTRQRILSSIGEASSVAFKKVPVWLTAESDRVWVYYAFFREKDFLKDYFKAKGEPKTEQQLEEIAAARVKMASINPGRQAKLIKSSEQKGATQFLNYFVETYKSIGRGLDLARIDLMEAKKDFGKGHKKAAAIRTLNASTRIAGLLAVSVFNKATTQHIAKIAMWGALFSMLSGDDDEDETLRKAKEYQEVIENMKKSLPLDEQGKDFVILARDGDKLFLQDVNRFDPLEPATAPLTSILEGDIDRAIAQVESLVFANSFLAGLYSAIAEPNKKVSWAYTHPEAFEMVDKKVKDLGGKFGVEASETFNFISKLVKPVTPRAAINFLNEMASEESEGSFEGESALNAIRYVGGWVQEYSPTSSVYRAAAGTKDTDGYNEVRSQLRKDYIGLANASADTIEQSLSRLITKEREAFNRMSEVYRSARAVANDKDAVDRELKNVINNRQIVRDIEDGTFNSGLWTEESKNSMISRLENSTQFKEKEIEEKIEQIEKLWEIYEEQRGD